MRRAMAVMALATLVSGCDYNRLVALREQIDAAWAQVENQLQRRNDLIPNLLEVTRGYAAHEKEIFVHEAVRAYNSAIKSFPTVLYANAFGFKPQKYFEAPEEAKKVPKVDFGTRPETAPRPTP